VVAVFYGFFVCICIYRELTGKGYWEIIQASSVTTANIMFLVVTAQIFGYLLTYYRVPVYVTDAFMAVASSPEVFMLLIVVLLTICGMFLEVGATNLILGPILAPIALKFGVDPVHFGLVFVFLLAMGQATPPFGTTLFVSCGVSGQPVSKVSRQVIPFVIVEVICALLFCFVPSLSTALGNLMS
ncbi:MAG: TRAP transporter large permease subunit, partial [Succinivibrio sp.]|nr:TRAP transporter large permease subunit [Succinivibrio sp.]